MNFRTEIKIPESRIKIEHYNKILTIGSCFAENIAELFKFYLFDVFENPFGVLYNPASVYNAVKAVYDSKMFGRDDLIFHAGEWHSFYHHSDFSHHRADECIDRINSRTSEVKGFVKECGWVIISLGTSFIYKHTGKNIIVSNCHKIPAAQFEKIFLAQEDSEEYLLSSVKLLKKMNPDLKIILTVSPVRHIKDGFAENQLSKSSLIVAAHNVAGKEDNCFYFPAYEIMMDDLRDYRFYEKDLLHPNKMAVEYIWEKFSGSYFSGSCRDTLKEIEPYSRGKQHRLRDTDSPAAKKFISDLAILSERLMEKYPYIKIEE